MLINFAPKSCPIVMFRNSVGTILKFPIIAPKLSQTCARAQKPRRHIMAFTRHMLGWAHVLMVRTSPCLDIPCSLAFVGTRPKIPVALYRGHEGEDSRRPSPWARGRRFPSPLPWARGRRFPSSFTVGTRPKIPVALLRRHRGRRFPSSLTAGTRTKIPVAFCRGHEY